MSPEISVLLISVDPGPWGAGIRFNGIRVALASQFTVNTFFFNAKPFAQEAMQPLSWLRPDWAAHATPGAHAAFRKQLREKIDASSPDILIFSGTEILPFLPQEIELPIILDAYDVNWVRLSRKLLPGSNPTWKRRLRAFFSVRMAKRYEGRQHALADEIWVCSEVDRHHLGSNGYSGSIRIVPNFFDKEKKSTVPARSQHAPTLLFVGTMGYYANRDGVRWFLQNCWQKILSQEPEAQFWVAGKWPEWAKPGPEYAQDGVHVLGYVDDLDALWKQADVAICPLRMGSGTRIKILEAWASQLPVLATSIGIEGLQFENGVNAMVADQPATLSQAAVSLLRDPQLRQRLGQAGHKIWLEQYTFDRVAQLIIRYCQEFALRK